MLTSIKPPANRPIFSALRSILLVALVGFFQPTARVHAQDDFGAATDLFPNFSLGGFGDGGRGETEDPARWSARYYCDQTGRGQIEVEASLAPHWHVYSTTQKPGGPTRTKISITAPSSVKVGGNFSPDHQPSKSISSIYNGLTIEEHEGNVVWSAPITLPVGFEEAITATVQGLVCKSGGEYRCMPVEEELTAQYAGLFSPGSSSAGSVGARTVAQAANNRGAVKVDSPSVKAAKPFRDGDYVVEWTAVVTPKQVAPGQTAVLQFTAKPDTTFHVYKSVVDASESSTNFVLTTKDGLLVGEPIADKPYVTKTLLPTLPPTSYYKGKVTWQLPIEIPADAAVGEKRLEGMIAYQACTETSCHRPTALKFIAKLIVGDAVDPQSAAIELVSAKSATALDAAAKTKWADPIKPKRAEPTAGNQTDQDNAAATIPATSNASKSSTSFPIILGFALLGGLILNVMPCVLPVVGLKIMGFVSQAGEDRGRVLLLNVVYALGILSVFAVFAAAAAVSTFGWGEQFTYFPVRLGLTLLLFALALSYLGVWEIPVPGFAAGNASYELQNREGLLGAFFKGAFATILATPCSGPLLGFILGLTLNLSPLQTIVIFMTVGLGMSLPYLVVGAKPQLVAWLPKPGPWMETLKQLMAFLFLGTVAFFFAQFNEAHKVPVFVSLIGVWFGCWIIGQVPNWAEIQKRLFAWGGGIAAATVVSLAAFHYLKPDDHLAWEDYTEARLQQLQSEGRTVLIDFSAKWCANCIVNYNVAINTEKTRLVVDELDAVALYADWTDHNQEIKNKLAELNSRSIPLLAIYPGNRPNQPIILRDIVSQKSVVEALRQAGASVGGMSASRVGLDTAMASSKP